MPKVLSFGKELTCNMLLCKDYHIFTPQSPWHILCCGKCRSRSDCRECSYNVQTYLGLTQLHTGEGTFIIPYFDWCGNHKGSWD